MVWCDNYPSYLSLEPSILTYKQDLEDDGFSVEIKSNVISPYLPDNAEGIREFLRNEAETHEMAGVLLVGDVPYIRYNTTIDTGTGPYVDIFPCDLYYMDLDGNWTDSDGNGIYDQHTSGDGDLGPEIWVGRLWASNIPGDEDELLINYFNKNHRFRTGELTLPRRALAYIDDHAVDCAYEIYASLHIIYGNETTLVVDPKTTNATDYKNRLNDTLGYEWIHLECHGSYKLHAFRIAEEPVPESWTIIRYDEVRSIDPHAFFYNIMACDSADYSQTNPYIAGSYIFADTYGLLVLSSTKKGKMYSYTDFYQPVAEGKCIGQAFKEWFEKNGEVSRFYYYGLTILGDPTLRTPRVRDVAVTNVTASKSVVIQNSSILINVTVENKRNFMEIFNITETFDVTLYANTTLIGNMTVTNLQPLTTTVLTFGWNTTGVAKGNYRISATAVLPLDNNPNDNTYTGGWVAVILKDDVAVTNVVPSNSRVVQNSTVLINVTVENKGNFTETFDVTLCANTTLIGTQTDITLTSRDSTTLFFTWNTTGFATGDYRISATAVLPVDNDPSDNVYTNGLVAVTFSNDIAVISVTAGDSLHNEIEVHSGWDVNINVTVRNEGISVESFNVTVYADVNTTVIGDEIIIGTQTNITLAAGNSTTLTFTWNTAGVPTCRYYTVSANATITTPGVADDDPLDNTLADCTVKVRICGDINGDDKVGASDIILLGKSILKKPGEPGYNAYADLNQDGKIGAADIIIQGKHILKKCTP